MTMTRDKIEELKRLAKREDATFQEYWGIADIMKNDGYSHGLAEYLDACAPQTILSLLALAERALEPQGQALPELPPLPDERFLGGDEAYGDAVYGYSATDMAAYARAYASQLALPAGPVPEGDALDAQRYRKAVAHGVIVLHNGAKACVGKVEADAALDAIAPSPAVAQPEPTPSDVRPDTVMAKPMPVNALWDAIGVYCEAVIDDELAACGIGDKVDPRMRIGAAKRLIDLIGDRTDHDAPFYPANRLHEDAHRTPAVAQPVPAHYQAVLNALGDMLECFDDGVGQDWSAATLDKARIAYHDAIKSPAVAPYTLETAPIGSFAPSCLGGGWTRNERGWESSAGVTFPRPGGDWTGEIRAQPAPDYLHAFTAEAAQRDPRLQEYTLKEVAQPVADERGVPAEKALKYIDDLLHDAQQQNLFGGGEDSSGALQCGQVDWDELRESIHAHFRAALCQPAEEGGKS